MKIRAWCEIQHPKGDETTRLDLDVVVFGKERLEGGGFLSEDISLEEPGERLGDLVLRVGGGRDLEYVVELF